MTIIEPIIRCLAGNPARAVAALNEDAWEEVAVTAIALGVAPLLHWHLEQAGVEPPPLTMAKLAVTRQAHARRNQAIARQLAEVLAACARQQVPVLVLKGAVLAPAVYPDAALRPMNDIDLLFRPADLPRVHTMLEQLGYEGKHHRADQGPGITKHLSTYRRPGRTGSTPNPYLSAEGDRTIEPHGSLEESWFGLKVDITPGVWARAVPVTLHGQPASRLAASDMVLHLAVHAAFHFIMKTSVFVQLYDVGRVLAAWQAELDWGQALTLARDAAAQPFVYAGLYWARSLYQAPVPERILATLAEESPAPLRGYVQGLDARAIFSRTQLPPLVTLRQRLQRGLLDRHEAARWAGSLRAKWQVWQTALAFHKTDTAGLVRQKVKFPALRPGA